MNARNAQHLVVLLQEFSQAADRYVEFTGAQFGTHRTDMNALSIIIKYERSGTLPSAKDLSSDLQLSAPATTAMLDRLARFGLIERIRSDHDRRVVNISPTDKASSMGREMFMPLSVKVMEMIKNYDAHQLQVVSQFMADAITAVDSAREEFVTLSPTTQPDSPRETTITR